MSRQEFYIDGFHFYHDDEAGIHEVFNTAEIRFGQNGEVYSRKHLAKVRPMSFYQDEGYEYVPVSELKPVEVPTLREKVQGFLAEIHIWLLGEGDFGRRAPWRPVNAHPTSSSINTPQPPTPAA